MSSFLKKINELFLDNIDHHAITWADLKKYPMFESQPLINGITVNKVFDNDDIMIFTTVIPKNKKFGIHTHDCHERCYIASGWLEDTMTKESKIRGQVISYSANVPHEPKAKEETVLTVTFNNPNL